jgi:hypothetical protein
VKLNDGECSAALQADGGGAGRASRAHRGKAVDADRVGNTLPTLHQHQPCGPLWYWPAGEATEQYQSGLQPNEKTTIRSLIPVALPRTGPRRARRASQLGRVGKNCPPERSKDGEAVVAWATSCPPYLTLDTFFWRSKRKYLGCGTNSRSKSIARQRTKKINKLNLIDVVPEGKNCPLERRRD